MVVSEGNSVTLPCEHNIKNLTRARWSHISLEGVIHYNLFYLNGRPTTHDNYEGLCGRYQPSCNLKILQANKESAGRYICMVGEPLEFEEKYGMDQMTYFIEIQLVVGGEHEYQITQFTLLCITKIISTKTNIPYMIMRHLL